MAMLIIPAIDLMGGKVVRLIEGKREKLTVFSDSPGDVARGFVDAGAERIHVVDLDGAFTGKRENLAALEQIIRTGASVQFGGGVRDVAVCRRLLDEGAAEVVVGTLAARDLTAFLAEDPALLRKIIVAVDAKEGQVFVEGWDRATGLDAGDMARRAAKHVAGVLYTDISRDGTGRGPNVERSAMLAQAIAPCPLIASGGIGNLDDLRRLANAGVPRAVVGRALYDHAFTFADAVAAGLHA